jgi:hypothetical protein
MSFPTCVMASFQPHGMVQGLALAMFTIYGCISPFWHSPSGWWYTYPSEKYEFVSHPPNVLRLISISVWFSEGWQSTPSRRIMPRKTPESREPPAVSYKLVPPLVTSWSANHINSRYDISTINPNSPSYNQLD